MKFDTPLVSARLLGRRKRFLADVVFPDGTQAVAHCANSGRMTACLVPGGTVLLSRATNPKRKLPWSWEIAYGGETGDVAILVHTGRPNRVVVEGIRTGRIEALAGYGTLRTEVRYDESSRCDIVLTDPPPHQQGHSTCFVEVKNVTLWTGGRSGAFPDAVSARGRKHLEALRRMVGAGHRAVLLYLVSRADIDCVVPADDIDPAYGQALRTAHQAGVEVRAVRAHITPTEVTIGSPVEVDLT
ncbi:MAG: DNA/RNA nuclease SfsA [Deltaproteobacteria bacterium]|nr:DNA/RNA nuclease SfsA [Deltaproteobacteria bacterium]HCH66731.1 DNA/RNA nuclease SfsA [Deltaproteobacteria bacterium]